MSQARILLTQRISTPDARPRREESVLLSPPRRRPLTNHMRRAPLAGTAQAGATLPRNATPAKPAPETSEPGGSPARTCEPCLCSRAKATHSPLIVITLQPDIQHARPNSWDAPGHIAGTRHDSNTLLNLHSSPLSTLCLSSPRKRGSGEGDEN